MRVRSMVAVACMMAAQASAADVAVPVPAGWRVSGQVASGGGIIALGLLPSDGREAGAVALVAPGSGGVLSLTVLGSVRDMAVSPDGRHLLVTHEAAGRHGVSLLSVHAGLLWTRQDGRRFDFSTSGEAIVAWSPGGPQESPGFSVLRLDGTQSWRAEFPAEPPRPLVGVVAHGAGDHVTYARGRSLRTLGPQGLLPWQTDLGRHERGFVGLSVLDPEHLVTRQADGVIKVLAAADLRPVHQHSRGSFEAGDLSREWTEQTARMLPWSVSPGRLLLHSPGEAASLVVDLIALTETAVRVPLTPSAGTLLEGVHGGWLIFFDAMTIAFRRVA